MGFDFTNAAFKIVATEFPSGDNAEPYTSTDHAVLNYLCTRADNESGYCWGGYGDMAKHTHYCRDACIKSIAKLGRFGFIKIHPPGTERGTNSYTVLFDNLVEASTVPWSRSKHSRMAKKEEPACTFSFEGDDGDELL